MKKQKPYKFTYTPDTLAEYILDILEKEDMAYYTVPDMFLSSFYDYLDSEDLPYRKDDRRDSADDSSTTRMKRIHLVQHLGVLAPVVRQSDIKLKIFIHLL